MTNGSDAQQDVWSPSDDVRRVLAIERERRYVEMIRKSRRRREELAESMSARGLGSSGAFVTAVNGAVFELFREFGNARLGDYVALAEDLDWEPDAAEWLHTEYRAEIDGTAKGQGLRNCLPGDQNERAVDERIGQLAHDLKSGADVVFTRARIRRNRRRQTVASGAKPEEDYRDCFISHAGEDRAEIAEPLAQELQQRGRSVWFSGLELTLGDSLRKKIDDGLRKSRYGVVVLSPHFFDKPWPEAELNALHSRAMNEGRKVILPVWHRITLADVSRHAPMLADLLGVPTSRGLAAVADEIIRALDFDRR